jgi:hypothetical protein
MIILLPALEQHGGRHRDGPAVPLSSRADGCIVALAAGAPSESEVTT